MDVGCILVTGGAGFIGRTICRMAQGRGLDVCALDFEPPTNPLPGVRYISADLSAADSVKRALDGRAFEYVVNAGGYIDHTLYFSGGDALIRAHLGGVWNLLGALDPGALKRFVQIGSSDEYGDTPAPQSETAREGPISPYSFAKAAATHFLQMLWRTERFPSVTVRLFLVYGPGQGARRFLPQIIGSCLNGERFPVSEGRQLRDFCFVDDVAEGILRALEVEEACGKVINLASGKPVSIRAAIEAVCEAIGKGQPDFGKVPYRPGENMALWADISLASKMLNWRPAVDFEEGLRRTIESCIVH